MKKSLISAIATSLLLSACANLPCSDKSNQMIQSKLGHEFNFTGTFFIYQIQDWKPFSAKNGYYLAGQKESSVEDYTMNTQTPDSVNDYQKSLKYWSDWHWDGQSKYRTIGYVNTNTQYHYKNLSCVKNGGLDYDEKYHGVLVIDNGVLKGIEVNVSPIYNSQF